MIFFSRTKPKHRLWKGVLLLLLTTSFHPLLAQQAASPLSKRITISFSGENMLEALHKIEKSAGLEFAFNAKNIDSYKTAVITYTEKSIEQVLKGLFQTTSLTFKELNGYIIINKQEEIKTTPAPKKDPGKITGKIMDEETGEPISNVTIRIGNKGTTSGIDGSFSIPLPKGKYEAEISSMGYGTKQVTDIEVKDNQVFELSITLKKEKNTLAGVLIKSSAKKESVASLYTKQRNAAELSDGISSEQISATPDKNVGETLKRITGVSTQENRKVVVRGIAERYNVPLLNGSPLPSTDVQERDFEFDMIPTNLVENIVVAKSATADMPYGFAGGMVQIKTKSVPTNDFTSFSVGTSLNSRTVGNDFLGYKRGKRDYLGFDDGGRDHFPEGIIDLKDKFNPGAPDEQNKIKAAQVAEQNKRIGGTERLGTRVYQPNPSQNYQFTMGRVYKLKKNSDNSFGFVGSLTYRNTQQNNNISSMHRGSWNRHPKKLDDPALENTGNQYLFNTTIGVLLNGGFKFKNHQINLQNLYTHFYDNRFTRLKGWTHEEPNAEFPGILEDDRPKFSDLLQNKIGGTSAFGRIKMEWSFARTSLNAVEKDASSASLGAMQTANKPLTYTYLAGNASDPGWGIIHRDQYTYKEFNNEAIINASYVFKVGKTSHTIKTGYNYLSKHAWYSWLVLPIGTGDIWGTNYPQIALQEWGNHMSMQNPSQDLFYNPNIWSLNGFEAKSKNTGAFVMFDHRLLSNFRFIWGVRADYFKLDTLKNAASLMPSEYAPLIFKEKKDWYFLPSAAITYTAFKDFNARLAYSKTTIRPGLMENSRFSRYNPNYGSVIRSNGVSSTLIDNYDAKLEWFPGAGELISAGFFYKYFDKPAEYYKKDNMSGSNPYVTVTNSDWAKVQGWEFEVRKSLGFIKEGLLDDIFINGNLTIQKSKVRARETQYKQLADGSDSVYYSYMKYPRALYGQVPLVYNLGLQYAGKKLGLNIVYNYMGYKTFFTSSSPELAEYERPRGQLDAQISYKFFKDKLAAKLNVSNITDAPYRFFINDNSTYEIKPDTEGLTELEWNERYKYKSGYSEKYEPMKVDRDGSFIGDRTTFIQYVGRTFSFTLTYNF